MCCFMLQVGRFGLLAVHAECPSLLQIISGDIVMVKMRLEAAHLNEPQFVVLGFNMSGSTGPTICFGSVEIKQRKKDSFLCVCTRPLKSHTHARGTLGMKSATAHVSVSEGHCCFCHHLPKDRRGEATVKTQVKKSLSNDTRLKVKSFICLS